MADEPPIIIIGGGPAGCTAALAIAEVAPDLVPRVSVFEAARYPRDKPCAGALGRRGDEVLAQLGVRVEVPGVRIDGVSFRGLAAEAAASPGGIGRVVRRAEFDHGLAKAAAARGIAFREGVRVTGVRVDANGYALVESSAGVDRAVEVLGCDGVGSVVRRALGVGAGTLRAQAVEVDTEPVAGDRARDLLHFDASDPGLTGYAWDFPTVIGGRALVCRGVYRVKLRRSADDETDIGELLDRRLRALGFDPGACRKKRYGERGYVPVDRLSAGPMLLAGEAAGIDPATGEGIAQAIECGAMAGRFAAAAVLSRRSGPVQLDGWTRMLARSRLARDLRIRTRVARFFFGPARAGLERLITRSPDFLYVGCQHFGAQSYDWARLLRVGAAAPRALFGGG